MSPAPVVLGVTGHRDLSALDEERFSEFVRGVLEQYLEALTHTEIILITGLAEGADQVAARVALNLPGITVIAALPMSLHDYREDFDGDARAEFNHLLERCSAWIEVVPPRMEVGELERDIYYQNHGRWLATNCQVLIAAWDGKPPQLVGGTADNIHFKARSLTPLPSTLGLGPESKPDPGAVFVCEVARRENIPNEGVGLGTWVLVGSGDRMPWPGIVDEVSLRINEFNRRVGRAPQATSATSLLFEASDFLATHLQRRYRHLLILIISLGLVLLASVDIMQISGKSIVVVVLSLLVVITLGSWAVLNRSGLREWFQQSRALAEGARVQGVWQSVGVSESVADDFLRGQAYGATWIRSALRGAHLLDLVKPTVAPDPLNLRNWIEGQVAYFQGNSSRPGAIDRGWQRHRRIRGKALFLLSIACIALAVDAAVIVAGAAWSNWLVDLLRFTWSMGLGGAVALISYGELMGYSQLARRYELSAEQFRQGLHDLDWADQGGNAHAHQQVALSVGREALRESSDWLAMQSERRVRPV